MRHPSQRKGTTNISLPQPDLIARSGRYVGRDLQRVADSLRVMLMDKWDAQTEAASFGLRDGRYHYSTLNTDTRPRWWAILEEHARSLQTTDLIRHPFSPTHPHPFLTTLLQER